MDDDTLIHQFEKCTFPFDQWHHSIHVKIAYLYLTRYDFDTASKKLRDGIRALMRLTMWRRHQRAATMR